MAPTLVSPSTAPLHWLPAFSRALHTRPAQYGYPFRLTTCETRYGRSTSMAADKKDYQSVLGALVDYGTLASIINKLNRVLIATEDTDLKKLIEPVIARVDKVLGDLPISKNSVSASLRQRPKI